jgi:hypothetical protein
VNVAQWRAFQVSSWADTARHEKNIADGSVDTMWASLPNDKKAWGGVDLGQPCRISRIEVVGDVAGNVELRISPTSDFKNAKVVAARPASSSSLVIRKAVYGAGDRVVDVTEKVRAARGMVQVDNTLAGGDPAPNVPKELRVDYQIDGQTQSAAVQEHGSLSLGGGKPWIVELPQGTVARFVRIGRTQPGDPLSIRELKVYGKY